MNKTQQPRNTIEAVDQHIAIEQIEAEAEFEEMKRANPRPLTVESVCGGQWG